MRSLLEVALWTVPIMFQLLMDMLLYWLSDLSQTTTMHQLLLAKVLQNPGLLHMPENKLFFTKVQLLV